MHKLTISEVKNNKKLINEFIAQNINLVLHTVHKFKLNGEHFEDAKQEALLAFYKSILNYDDSYDNNFTTYSVMYMEGSIMKMYRDGYFKTIRPPRWNSQAGKLHKQGYSVEEIAKQLDRPVEAVQHMLTVTNCTSLDIKASDYNGGTTIDDMYNIVDSNSIEDQTTEQQLLYQFTKSLDNTAKTILLLRYKGYTQTEIANYLNTPQPNVCRLLKKLKPKFESYLYS